MTADGFAAANLTLPKIGAQPGSPLQVVLDRHPTLEILYDGARATGGWITVEATDKSEPTFAIAEKPQGASYTVRGSNETPIEWRLPANVGGRSTLTSVRPSAPLKVCLVDALGNVAATRICRLGDGPIDLRESPRSPHKAAMSEQPAALRVSLAPHEGSSITMTVHNPTDAELRFCSYHTPFEGIRNNIFRVARESGKEMEFQGMMAKRRPPEANDYLTVQPGESVEATVDLRPSWKLKRGTWTVQYRGTNISGLGDSEPIELEIR